jgi:hypothetical protein
VAGFESVHNKFGPIVGLNFGGERIVSINDLDILQKVADGANSIKRVITYSCKDVNMFKGKP